MKYKIIASGSSGNAVLLDGRILIDCGVPYKALREVEKQIQLVLLTHRHLDHLNLRTVEMLAFNNPRIWWAFATDDIAELIPQETIPHSKRLWVTYGKNAVLDDVHITPHALIHDVPNTAWEIRTPNGTAFYATDTDALPDDLRLSNLDLYMVEANYEQDDLAIRAQTALERGEYAPEFRTAHTHLSKEQADKWLAKHNKRGGEVVYIHQHKEKFI